MQRTWCRTMQASCLTGQSLWAHMSPFWLVQWAMSSCCLPHSLTPIVFPLHLLMNSPCSEGNDTMENSNLYCLHDVWLWVSEPAPICCQGKPLWWLTRHHYEYSRISLWGDKYFIFSGCIWFFPSLWFQACQAVLGMGYLLWHGSQVGTFSQVLCHHCLVHLIDRTNSRSKVLYGVGVPVIAFLLSWIIFSTIGKLLSSFC